MTRLTLLQSTIVLLTIVILASCSKSGGSNPKPQNSTSVLAISSLSVTSGAYNTSVIITGTGFSTIQSDDQVFFNGKAATVTAATTTQLTAAVPLGAGTGNITISVNNGKSVSGPLFSYQLSYIATTLAGSNMSGEVNGTGAAAILNGPLSIAADAADNLFITGNDPLVRKITPQGVVTSYAGLSNSPANNGIISAQQLNIPDVVAVDKNENLYVVDAKTSNIWKITAQGSVSALKDNTGAPVDVFNPQGLTIDNAGNIYVADTFDNQIKKITPQGVVTILAGNGQPGYENGQGASAFFNTPTGIAIDVSGNVYVTDFFNSSLAHIRKITPDGTVSNFTSPVFLNPLDLAIDSSGNLFVADFGTGLINKVTPSGVVSNFAGQGYLNGVRTGLVLDDGPHAIAIDNHDVLYIASGNEIIKIAYE
jgi:hypothetical protein